MNTYRQEAFYNPVAIAKITLFNFAGDRTYFYCVIRAFFTAYPASGAIGVIYHDDPVLIFIQGIFFTCFNTWGIVTVIAKTGDKEFINMRISAGLICFNAAPERPEWNIIFDLAGYLAGETPDTPVKINQHGIFFLWLDHIY